MEHIWTVTRKSVYQGVSWLAGLVLILLLAGYWASPPIERPVLEFWPQFPRWAFGPSVIAIIFAVVALIMPFRVRASSASLVITSCVIPRRVVPADSIVGVIDQARWDKHAPLLLRIKGRRRHLMLGLDGFNEPPDAIEAALSKLFGRCAVDPALEPGAPIWKECADQLAAKGEFRWKRRFAKTWEIVGSLSLVCTAIFGVAGTFLWSKLSEWFVSHRGFSDPFMPIAMLILFGCLFLWACAGVALLDLVRGGADLELIATRDTLTLRRRFRTITCPRSDIVSAETRTTSGTPLFLTILIKRASRPKRRALIHERHWTRARGSMLAAFVTLYGHPPVSADQAPPTLPA